MPVTNRHGIALIRVRGTVQAPGSQGVLANSGSFKVSE